MTPRKIWLWRETVHRDGEVPAMRTVTRVAVAVVIKNPCAGAQVQDLSELVDLGPVLAARYLPDALALLPLAPVAYGKAAIVGMNGEIEHAAALLHPKLGKPMRDMIGGGSAIIPSTVKVAAMGARIDIPLGHKDDVWSFNELDTMTLGFEDAPHPDEILIILALSDGGRPAPRISASRIAT